MLVRSLLFSLLFIGAGVAGAQETEPEAAPAAGDEAVETREVRLTPIRVPGIPRELTVVDFEAPSVGRRMKYIALLPENYDEEPDRRYPVLYLLHGFSQNYTVFPRMGVPQYTEEMNLIVIMPDAGNTWYINWAESEDGKLNRWADYIVYDLIESVDAVFRTVPSRLGRAISGVSMGGYGAMTLGLRRPDLFVSIASHSGTLSYAKTARERLEAGEAPQKNIVPSEAKSEDEGEVPGVIAIPGFTYQYERYPQGIAFATPEQAAAYDPFTLVGRIPPQNMPHIYIDCATGDSLIEDARAFMQVLLENELPFTFAQSPGAHGVRYWTRELAQSIAIQYSLMKNALNRVPDPLSLPSTDNTSGPPMPRDHSQHQR